MTGGKGVHVVYDGVGKDTWEEDFLVVRTKGSIITYGNASGPVPAFEPLKLSPKCLKVSRPTLQPFINEPEDFAKYAEWIFDAVKDGGLNVSLVILGIARTRRRKSMMRVADTTLPSSRSTRRILSLRKG